MNARDGTVTQILAQIRGGEPDAERRLLALVYDELREIAQRLFRSQPADHTLEPTVLVHEAYLKMVPRTGEEPIRFADRAHFLRVAAIAMRQVLVNHARDKAAGKRGGGRARERVWLDRVVDDDATNALEVLAVHEALEQLAALDPGQARIAELRFFGGLTLDETAEVLGLSRRKISIEWRMARGWLAGRLGADETA